MIFLDSLNKYLYANSDPLFFVDPSGNIGIIAVGGFNINVGATYRIGSSKAAMTAAAKFSAELAFEIATGVPVLTSPRGFVSAVRSFRKQVGQLANGVTKKLKEGSIFEDAVAEVWGLKSNTKCFMNGEVVKGRPKGCKIPDFFSTRAGKLVEVKNSMGAVKKAQFIEFLKISQKTGQPMTFVFKQKPTTTEVEKLQRWAVQEVGKTDNILLNIIHVLD